jgi:hypothetical protein
MKQNQVNNAVQRFIKNFKANPYLHRTEHSLHIALFNELFNESCPTTFMLHENYQTNYVHKEFPGRRINTQLTVPETKLGYETTIDIVVLEENQKKTSIKIFLDGDFDIDFAFELSLEYDIEHLCWDIFKFITGSNESYKHKNYIIHLYHRDHRFDATKIQKKNQIIEWCYYLIQLCIKYSKNPNNDDYYTEIKTIIKRFVCKSKSNKITEANYDGYLPTDSSIQDVLKNMKFVLVSVNHNIDLRNI